MTQQDTKITTLVAVPNKNCDGCCFDFGDGYPKICNFIKCFSGEREDKTSVIFMIGH